MKTIEQIFQELDTDPANAVLTKMVNGLSANLTAVERDRVMRGWAESIYQKQVKIWPDVRSFWDAFTPQEKVAIAMSDDQSIAYLRMELLTWAGAVHADDARVVVGLDRLEALGILTPSRRQEVAS